MSAKKILYITQEIFPYVPESQMATAGRDLPQTIQEKGYEIRTFMPKWGNINERRNQLHEVIRLSGMNIIIDDTDHPLIIKVASIQAARMQVYFIDNDDFFHKREMRTDAEGKEYEDNAERAIFYARGVLETVKKLRWVPDVIHCQGWISSIVPLYIKQAFNDSPSFANTKVVFSAYEETPTLAPTETFAECVNLRDATPEIVAKTGIDFSQPHALEQLAIHYCDGFIQEGNVEALTQYAEEKAVPTLKANGSTPTLEEYEAFYQKVFGENEQ